MKLDWGCGASAKPWKLGLVELDSERPRAVSKGRTDSAVVWACEEMRSGREARQPGPGFIHTIIRDTGTTTGLAPG